jgi:hypothetical protein
VTHTFNGKATFGSAIPFDFNVANSGPQSASGVVVTINFAGARLKTSNAACGPPVGNTMNCTFTSITTSSNQGLQLVFEATIAGAIVVNASVTSESLDPDITDNLGSDSVKVQPRPRAQRGN